MWSRMRSEFTSLGVGYRLIISPSPPSPGYEALLIKRRENPLLARVKAYLTVSQGRKIANESRRYRDVVAAIRFLAKPNRSRWAVTRKMLHHEKRGSSAPFSLKQASATISSSTCSHRRPREMNGDGD